MKKLVLIGHRSDRFNLLKALHQSKLVEIVATRNLENTSRLDNTATLDTINEKLSRIGNAFTFMRGQEKLAQRHEKATKKEAEPYKYTPVKEAPFSSIARMSYNDFSVIVMKEVELLSAIGDLESIDEKQNENNSKRLKLLAENETLDIYKYVSAPFSAFKDTEKTSVVLGYISPQRESELKNFADENDWVYIEIYEGSKFTPFVAVTLKENTDELSATLQELDYVKSAFNYNEDAVTRIQMNNEAIAALENEKYELMNLALKKQALMRDFKTLYDYYLIELAKFNAIDGFAATAKSFVLEAWYPAEQEERIKNLLDETSDSLVYEFREPEENEVVPTLVRSNKIVEPYEDVTNMYSVPNYRSDVDPNPVMAFFYFLFFGIMMADAVYGVLLAVGGFVLYKLKKPTPGKGRLLLIIAMGGISTAIWGVLFGSYFGFPTSSMTDASGNALNFALLFNPLDEPLYMLIMCFALGFIQIIAGMVINAINLFKRGRWLDALCADFTWFAIFAGIVCIALPMLIDGIPDSIKYLGIALACVGAFALVLSGVRGKKGLKAVKGFFGGFGKLYDGVNILSDILSYSRLFGLALSGGVVAMVVNMICEVVAGFFPANIEFIGYIICIPVYMIGHLFNIAISALGAYVHNCRLQYIEFYGKFYEGGGHQFIPFGSMTKYTYVEMPASENNTETQTA